MIGQDIRRIQEDIVRALAGNVTEVLEGEWEDREWVHLLVHIEIDPDGGRSSSMTFALAHKPGQPLEDISFHFPREAKKLFNELAEACAALARSAGRARNCALSAMAASAWSSAMTPLGVWEAT